MRVKSFFCLLIFCAAARAQALLSSRPPDERFKLDLLVVVAHPDDESVIGAYLAKAAFDEHKRIGVVFGTRGNSGGNAIGEEQASSLAAIREIEGRRALASLGVFDVWFLDGPDTPGQDVLRSLETWDHGRALGKLVRIVRLTRPSVVVTWLPLYSAGENHGDHQAAGVIATEAFDVAGDPTQYPEQVTPPREPWNISNLTEGLRPWQAQKLYFFSDASHHEFLKGKGPEYAAATISPAKGKSYAVLSAEECAFHLTQSDSGYLAKKSLEHNDLTGTYFNEPSRLVFGKSHVDASVTGDLFEAVKPAAVRYVAVPGYHDTELPTRPALSLGGPWGFYREFWQVHGLTQLASLLPPEVEAGVSTRVTIPIVVQNAGSAELDGVVKVSAPQGWSVLAGAGDFKALPGETKAGIVLLAAPKKTDDEWRDMVISVDANGRKIGEEKIRVKVVPSSLPQ